MSLALHYWMGDVHHCSGLSSPKWPYVSTHTVLSGTLNSSIPYHTLHITMLSLSFSFYWMVLLSKKSRKLGLKSLYMHVWLYWPRPLIQQRNKKLTQIRTGPWKILQFISLLVVKIQHTKSHKVQTVHIDWLTPCYSSPSPPMEQQTSHTETRSQKNLPIWLLIRS